MYCYTGWTNLCWKLKILTTQHGLLQPPSQRAATNANVSSVKWTPDRMYPSLFVVTFRSLIWKAAMKHRHQHVRYQVWRTAGTNVSESGLGHIQGVPEGNVPDFGRMFLTLKYTDITQNPYVYPKLNGYRDNGERSLKVWQLLHTYWLTNTY